MLAVRPLWRVSALHQVIRILFQNRPASSIISNLILIILYLPPSRGRLLHILTNIINIMMAIITKVWTRSLSALPGVDKTSSGSQPILPGEPAAPSMLTQVVFAGMIVINNNNNKLIWTSWNMKIFCRFLDQGPCN